MQNSSLKKVVYANYDWDDNIIFMPTRIVFFSKRTNLPQEIEVSTELFAHVRSKVGTESCKLFLHHDQNVEIASEQVSGRQIDLIDYEVRNDDSTGSFRQFRDCSRNYFLNDLEKALHANSFGPSFKDFVEHCSTPELANNVTIITARGHAPETLHKGLVRLQQLGLIKCVPPVENMYPCSYKGLKAVAVASAQNPSDAKKNILMSILDKIQHNSNNDNSDSVHSFGFSDDDSKTMKLVSETLNNELQKQRWSGFEINLYFTGNKTKQRQVLLVKEKVEEVA